MDGDPVYDFPAVSMKGDRTPVNLVEAEPGRTVVDYETVYEAIGLGPYDTGRKIGTVSIIQRKSSTRGRVPFTAHFKFGDEDTVTLTGVAPGNGSWKGQARVGYDGGTGKFADRGGEIPLESNNPKRWG